jgi:hypothetical protein
MFDDDLANFAQVASLVLALLTVFTSTRAATLHRLETAPGDAKKGSATLEIALVSGVLLATSGVILSGAPLWIESLDHAAVTQKGALPLAFAVSWPLMLGLVAWQVALISKAARVRGKLD